MTKRRGNHKLRDRLLVFSCAGSKQKSAIRAFINFLKIMFGKSTSKSCADFYALSFDLFNFYNFPEKFEIEKP